MSNSPFDLSSPWILKFNEGKGWPSPIFQIDESDFAIFIKEILYVTSSDVRRQISNVDSAVFVSHCNIGD